MPDGSIVLVEIKGGRVTRVAPDGAKHTIATPGGGPNGAAIGPDGALYVCNNGGFEWHDVGGITVPGEQPADYSGGRIERIDLATGAVSVLYASCDGNPLRGPNDLVFDRDGGFWFTDHGKIRKRDRDRGGLYWAKPDGSEIREVVYPLDSPNGVGLSPDGRRVYVAETWTGRVWWWEIAEPGVVKPVFGLGAAGGTLLVGLPRFQLLDSLAVDGGGPRLRRDAGQRAGHHGDRAGRPRRGEGRAARPAHHQHLLRRRRSPHRLRHPLGHRKARLVPLAPPRSRAAWGRS